eukprot:5030192-Amphidinium_carterae.1
MGAIQPIQTTSTLQGQIDSSPIKPGVKVGKAWVFDAWGTIENIRWRLRFRWSNYWSTSVVVESVTNSAHKTGEAGTRQQTQKCLHPMTNPNNYQMLLFPSPCLRKPSGNVTLVVC